MAVQPIQFNDGAAYDRSMGVWSRLAGDIFLDWMDPAQGLRWIDIGCGSGAFTERVIQRYAPSEIQGIDPSEGQLAYARTRADAQVATFLTGDAMALPFAADRFDVAVMALVLFFVPEPVRGVAEMVRVVRPGGIVAAYLWDIPGGGFPFEPIQAAMRARGLTPALPPSVGVANAPVLRGLWEAAGLDGVEIREIAVRRSFDDFEQFWAINTSIGTMRGMLDGMAAGDAEALKASVCAALPADAAGRVSYGARAHAIKGRVPG